MRNIIIIHGAYGNPKENWFPWLKDELEKLDCNVIVPEFPTPENQSLDIWLKFFNEFYHLLTSNSIIIGHSIGVAFVLRVIEGLNLPIRAAFLVSGFIDYLDNPTFDRINKTFIHDKFDWEKIKKNCVDFYIYHGENDPYVPLEKSESLAKHLGVDVKIIKNGGHLNKESGYDKFPELLEDIKNE